VAYKVVDGFSKMAPMGLMYCSYTDVSVWQKCGFAKMEYNVTFANRNFSTLTTVHVTIVVFPLWIVILLGFWPLRAYARICRKHTQDRDGLCYSCGYNLTGNISGRCPECGLLCNHRQVPVVVFYNHIKAIMKP